MIYSFNYCGFLQKGGLFKTHLTRVEQAREKFLHNKKACALNGSFSSTTDQTERAEDFTLLHEASLSLCSEKDHLFA